MKAVVSSHRVSGLMFRSYYHSCESRNPAGDGIAMDSGPAPACRKPGSSPEWRRGYILI